MWWRTNKSKAESEREVARTAQAFAQSLDRITRATAARDALMHQMVRDTLDTWRKVIQGLMLRDAAAANQQVAALLASGAAVSLPADPTFREPELPPEPEDDPVPDLLPLGEPPASHRDGGDPPNLGDPLV